MISAYPKETQILLKSLPNVRGQYRFQVDLSRLTWFRVGGPAHVVFKPADLEDLAFFLRHKPVDLPVFMLGVGSNVLVRSGGIPGVTIRLGKGFTNLAVTGTSVEGGAALLDRVIAQVAVQESLTGFEYLGGIPGTLGGALRMNAGCYGCEIQDSLEAAFALDDRGRLHTLTPEEMGFRYRGCSVPEEWIFVGARFRGQTGKQQRIQERLNFLLSEREETQPVHTRTGGSTFANPLGSGMPKAWELIDQAGCRGLFQGKAQVSELHCNFLVNTGGATADDLETLGETVRQKVFKTSGIHLVWEIKRVGVFP